MVESDESQDLEKSKKSFQKRSKRLWMTFKSTWSKQNEDKSMSDEEIKPLNGKDESENMGNLDKIEKDAQSVNEQGKKTKNEGYISRTNSKSSISPNSKKSISPNSKKSISPNSKKSSSPNSKKSSPNSKTTISRTTESTPGEKSSDESGIIGHHSNKIPSISVKDIKKKQMKGKQYEEKQQESHMTSYQHFCYKYVDPIRNAAGAIVETPSFQYTILAMIIVNSIMMSIQTAEFVRETDLLKIFLRVDLGFLIVFTIELGLQFVHKGLNLFKDGWLVFDFVSILASWVSSDVQIIRAFRVFRAFRLVTKVKVLKNLVIALLTVLPRMGAILSLLILVIYIFGVVFTSLFKNIEGVDPAYFGTLGRSFLTLFEMLTLEWSDIARELRAVEPFSEYLVVFFIVTSGFIVYNLFVAVLCDAVNELREKEELEGLRADNARMDEDGPRLKKRIKVMARRIKKLQGEQKKLHVHVEDLMKVIIELEDMLNNELDGETDGLSNNLKRSISDLDVFREKEII